MSSTPLTIEDFILFILNRLQPDRSDKMVLNKIAFLVEFAHLYFKENPLTNAEYAAIDHGPVINDYRAILTRMEKKGLIKIDDYKIRLLDSHDVNVPVEIDEFASPLIAKYSQMTFGELRALTHSMDSYLITTKNEKVMGNIIQKNLAGLETIFEDSHGNDTGQQEDIELPAVNFKKLVKYEL